MKTSWSYDQSRSNNKHVSRSAHFFKHDPFFMVELNLKSIFGISVQIKIIKTVYGYARHFK